MRRFGHCWSLPAVALLVTLAVTASAAAQSRPLTDTLSLDEAIQRGLEYNLGIVNGQQGVREAQGRRRVNRAALLPSVMADLTETRQQLNLAAMGFKFDTPFPEFSLPDVVGPFNQFDLRVRLSQSVFDRAASHSYRAAGESVRASERTAQDARDTVVLAVGGTYVQALAARARVETARTELETALALLQQAQQRRDVGLVAQVDVDRSQVQALMRQQRLIALQNDFAKLKIDLTRMIGAPPTDHYVLADDLAFTGAPVLDVDAALQQAREQRADLQAAEFEVQAAERELAAARAAYLPTASVNADIGGIGPNPADVRQTFSIVGTVRVPIWRGGRVEGQVAQADAALARRQAARDDLSRQVEAEIRKALLDVESLAAQVEVAKENLRVTRETLDLTRQRYEAGVSDNVEVVQAQESVSTAAFDHINSVFAHSLAKLNLARAMGNTESRLRAFLGR